MRKLFASLGLGRPELRAWAMYDVANSAFVTTIITAVFPIYFHRVAARDLTPSQATGRFATATTLALGLIAIASPFLGALADFKAAKKRLLAAFLAMGAVATAAMWFIREGDWLLACALFVVGNIGVAGSFIFYDALLPAVARPEEMDRVSSAGYALGYLGGLVLLALNLAWIQMPERFGLPDAGAGSRLSFVSVALWWVLFSIPLFRRIPEPPRLLARGERADQGAVRASFARLRTTLSELRGYRQAFLLLVAFLVYNDGIGTIIRMATAYGTEIGIGQGTLIAAILVVQAVGIPAAFAFGALASRITAKRAIFLSLVVYAAISVIGFYMRTGTHFLVLAGLVGLVQGGSQALSRSLFASMIPAHKSSEFFAFFAVFEKFAGILGPLVFAGTIAATGSSRNAILAVIAFFVVGGVILSFVDVDEGRRIAREAEAKAALDSAQVAVQTPRKSPDDMHDVVIVSDLHLGRGKNLESGRYFSLETFFYDEDFRRFCLELVREAIERQAPLRLVLNGDVFDLLRIDPEAPAPDASGRDRRFGEALTPAAAARLVEAILAGHPLFAEGICEVLRAGHEVVFLPGNHDIEIQWPPVQEIVRREVLARVRAADGEGAADSASTRLRFEPWFLYEPGRLWIEHGCQYDTECSFRYPLRSGLVDKPDALHEAELDFPLGNFFQRYLYNAFGPITFIVPSTRANFRYFKWLLFNEPRLLFRVLASHGPFSLQVLRRLAKSAGKRRKDLEVAHAVELTLLAQRSGLGERLGAIDGLKNVRADITQAGSQIAWQLVKIASAILLVAFIAAGLWFAGFHGIGQLRAGFWPKAALFLVLNFVFLIAGTVALAYALRSPPAVPPRPLRNAAQRIVELLDVPIVAFGHTHDEVLWRLARGSGEKAWYFNTGTWISVFTHDVLYPRERVQFTFLRVRGHEAELLHWSPGRREALPVVLLDDEAPGTTGTRMSMTPQAPG